MPASLVTDYKCIAQSGDTIDGRFIKPEWLTEMAETYDPAVYTAKLWIDHMRYSSYGSVRELKAEKVGDVVKLFAKISPSRSLLQMNQVWEEYLHFSIEPDEDFAKTGRCYLTGLAMTDKPASLGTEEMRFSQTTGRTFTARYPGEKVPDLRDGGDEDQQLEKFTQKLARLIFRTNKTEQETEGEEPMDKEQFEAFKTSLETTQQTVAGVADVLEKFIAAQNPDGGDGEETPPDGQDNGGGDNNTDFSALQTGLEGLGEQFKTLIGRLETALPGTQFGDTSQPAEDKDGIL